MRAVVLVYSNGVFSDEAQAGRNGQPVILELEKHLQLHGRWMRG